MTLTSGQPAQAAVAGEGPEVSLESVTTGFYLDDEDLRPPACFRKSYAVLDPYESTGFAGVVLKKTKNGHRSKSGIKIERDISPKRSSR